MRLSSTKNRSVFSSDHHATPTFGLDGNQENDVRCLCISPSRVTLLHFKRMLVTCPWMYTVCTVRQGASGWMFALSLDLTRT